MNTVFKTFLILMLMVSPCWGALHLNGDSDYLVIQHDDSIDSTIFTVSFWINCDAWGKDDIVTKRYTTESSAWAIELQTDGAIDMWYNTSGWKSLTTSGGSVVIGDWQHWLYTMTDNGTVTHAIYLNGVQLNEETESVGITQSTQNLTIGAFYNSGSPKFPFDGKISEIAIWDVVLSQHEIEQLASSMTKRMPLKIRSGNLQMYLPLDEFPNGKALDTSSDGYKDMSSKSNHAQGVDADGDSLNTAEEVLSYP